VLVEGGAQLTQAQLQQDLVDRVMFYIAPKLLGGSDGFGIFSGTGPEWLDAARNVDITNVRRFGTDILIEGEVCRCLPV
jgi:diaminohydroxyphosphoribosylaminopyrimidine deaminase/5-amino-6-(5-phosphoribosylamino)uracil reductase